MPAPITRLLLPLILVTITASSCSSSSSQDPDSTDTDNAGAVDSASTDSGTSDFSVDIVSETFVPNDLTTTSVDVAGSQIYMVRAIGAATNSQTVLFLHGAAFTSQTWLDNGIFEQVQEAGLAAIAIDLPGSGQSDTTSLPPADFLEQLFKSIDLEPADTVIMSPSMSGGFSLPALRDPFFSDLAGYVPVAPVGVSTFLADSDLVSTPALVVWGDGDGSDPLASATTLAAGFESSEVLIIEDAGHAAYQQQPDAFAIALIDFVNAH